VPRQPTGLRDEHQRDDTGPAHGRSQLSQGYRAREMRSRTRDFLRRLWQGLTRSPSGSVATQTTRESRSRCRH
jgi:hypothetical protein